MDEAQQIALAEYFTTSDIVLKNLLDSSVETDSIRRFHLEKTNKINDYLSTKQKYDLYVANKKQSTRTKYTYSQFAIGLRYRDTLGLSPSKTLELYDLVDTLKKMKNSFYDIYKKSYDTRIYESKILSVILTSEQYTLLLSIKNKGKAFGMANNAWIEIEKRLLDDDFNKENTINEIKNYYIAKLNNLDRNRHDILVQKAIDREIYINRPGALRILQKARRSVGNDTIGLQFNWDD